MVEYTFRKKHQRIPKKCAQQTWLVSSCLKLESKHSQASRREKNPYVSGAVGTASVPAFQVSFSPMQKMSGWYMVGDVSRRHSVAVASAAIDREIYALLHTERQL